MYRHLLHPTAKRTAILSAGIAALLSGSVTSRAVDYYWDPTNAADGSLVGGTATWDTVVTNTFFTTSPTDDVGTPHVGWGSALQSAGTDTVIFGGTTAGTVTIAGFTPIQLNVGTGNSNNLGVSRLRFETTGYTLTGSSIRPIGTAVFTVNPGVTATINSAINGAALNGYVLDTDVEITGGGTLRLGGGNGTVGFTINGNTTVEAIGGTFSGFNNTTISAGSTLRMVGSNRLSAPARYSGAGTFDMNGTTQSMTTLGGTLSVTNSTATADSVLNLNLASTNQTLTGVISNGTGKITLATSTVFSQSNNNNQSVGIATQTLAGANTYTGSTSLGRATLALDFANAAAPASNILYNSGFVGNNPAADDGKLIITRLLSTAGVTNAATGTLANLTLTGKASTTNSQSFNGLRLEANAAASVIITPNATANTVTLDLGAIERNPGSLINFATTNAQTALSASAIVKTTSGTASSTLVDAGGVAYATLGGREWAAKNAANDTLVAATYTTAGVTSFAANSNITTAADVKLSADSTITTLRYGGTTRANVALGGATLTTGGILVSNNMTGFGSVISGGTLKSPGSDVVVLNYAANNRWFGVDAVVADGASATGLTTGGIVPTQLLQNNTFTGAINVQQSGLTVTGNNTPSAVHINGSLTELSGNHLPGSSTSGTLLQLGNNTASGSIGSVDVNIGVRSILAIKRTDNFTLNNTTRGVGGLTQSGSGTTTLVSAATAKYGHVGDTTVTAGTLKLDYTASNTGIVRDESRLVLGGGTLEFATVAGTTHNEVFREFRVISGASTITKTGTGAGRIRLNSVNDLSPAGATLNFTAAGIADTDTTTTNGIMGSRARFTVGTAGTYDWAIGSTGAGDTAITAFAGYAALNTAAGTDTANSLQNLTAPVAFGGTRTTNSLKLTNTSGSTQAVDIVAGNTLTLTSGGILVTGTDAVEFTNGTLNSNSSTPSDLIIHQYNTGGLTIGSVISNGAGASTLTKSGNGTLTLNGTNTYTGATFLNGGTTIISSNANLGAPATGATVVLNNGTLRATTSVILSNGPVGTNNRAITLNGIAGTLEVDGGATVTIGGTIAGPGGLIKTGTGTLDIRSANYTGATTVTAGTLRYGAGVNNGYSPLVVGAAGTADIAGNANTIGSLEGNGTVTNSGAAATLTVGSLNTDTTFGGQITNGTNALSLAKTGSGSLTLTGANNYTGSTTINGGELLVNGSISGAVSVAASGTLGGSNGSIGAVTVSIGGTIAPGNSIGTLNTGALSLAAGSTFSLEIDTTSLTSDLVAVTGNLTLADTDDAVLTISDLTPALITAGVFPFISYTGTWDGDLFTYSGAIVADDSLITVGGNQFALDYNFGGNSVALVAVPEPSALFTLVGGVGLLLGLRRRRS